MKVFVTAKGALYLEHGCITRATSHRSTVRLFRNNPMMVEQQLDCGFLLGLSKTSVCSVLFNFEGSLLIKEQGIVDMQPSEKYTFRIHNTTPLGYLVKHLRGRYFFRLWVVRKYREDLEPCVSHLIESRTAIMASLTATLSALAITCLLLNTSAASVSPSSRHFS